jgi:hypothetical protein
MKRTPVQRREASPRSTVTEIVRLDNPKDFERVRFVLKAVLKDPARPFAAVVHVEKTAEGSRLAATDGKRLHAAEIRVAVKSGDYIPVLTRGAVSFGKPLPGIQFPDWKKAEMLAVIMPVAA